MLTTTRRRLFVTFLLGAFVNTTTSTKQAFLKDFFEYKNVYIISRADCWRRVDNANTFQGKFISFAASQSINHHRHYLLMDFECVNTSARLIEIGTESGFKQPDKYLILANKHNDFELLRTTFQNSRVSISSDVVIAFEEENSNEYQLLQLYKISLNDTSLNWEEYGHWNINGLKLKTQNEIPTRRRNLQGKKFTINQVVEYPESLKYLNTFRFMEKDLPAKQMFGALHILVEYCNMTYSLNVERYFGYYNKTTGKFNGIIGKLSYDSEELSASGFLFTKQRLKFVDFIKLFNPLYIRFMFVRPAVSYITDIFTITFHNYVWYSLFGIVGIFSLLLIPILRVEYERDPLKRNSRKYTGIASDALLISLEALCQQGTMTNTRTLSGRILFYLFFLALMVFYVSYSGNIVVLLQSTRTLRTSQELLDSPMTVGALNSSYMPFYMSVSTNPVHQQIYKNKMNEKAYYPLKVGLEKMRREDFAFHTEVWPAYLYMHKRFTEDEMCRVQELKGFIPEELGYVPVPKNFPYKKILKVGLLWIDECGLQKRQFGRFIMKPTCYGVVPSVRSVGIIDIRAVLLFFVYGLVLSLTVFFVEQLVHYKMQHFPVASKP